MLCEKDIFLLNLLKNHFNGDVKKNSYKFILNDIIKHKIYLRYYDVFSKLDIFKEKRELLKAIKMSFLKKIKTKRELLKEIIEIFNSKKLDYIVYKGYVLDYFCYKNCEKREYNDIDIIVKNPDDLKFFINALEEHFFVDNIGKSCFNSINSEIQLYIFYKNDRIPIELKKLSKSQIIFNEDSDLMNINTPIGDIKTFNYEMTFLNLISYFSYYNLSANSLLLSKKIIFKYPVELHDFITNNFEKINLEYLKHKILANNMEKKVVDTLFILSEIFENPSYLKIFENLKLNFVSDTIYRFFPIHHMYLYREETADIIKKHLYPNFIFNYSKYINKNKSNYLVFDSKISVGYVCTNKKILVNFKYNTKSDWILYFQLYGFDINNEFYNPFLPVFIHVSNNVLITESLYPRNMQCFRDDMEKRSDGIEFSLLKKRKGHN